MSAEAAEVQTTCRAGCGREYLPTKTPVSLAAFARAYPEGLTCTPCRHVNRQMGATPCRACQRGLCAICHGILDMRAASDAPCTCDHG